MGKLWIRYGYTSKHLKLRGERNNDPKDHCSFTALYLSLQSVTHHELQL